MNATHVPPMRNRRWTPVLAALALLLPLGTQVLVSREATAGGAASDFRASVAVLVLGLFSAIAALVASRDLAPAWLCWLSRILAIAGALLSAYLLWSLVGLCGLQVLWATCSP